MGRWRGAAAWLLSPGAAVAVWEKVEHSPGEEMEILLGDFFLIKRNRRLRFLKFNKKSKGFGQPTPDLVQKETSFQAQKSGGFCQRTRHGCFCMVQLGWSLVDFLSLNLCK